VLIIGGTGYLYGGLIGAVLFKLMQDYVSRPHAAILAVLDRPAAGGDRAGRSGADRARGRHRSARWWRACDWRTPRRARLHRRRDHEAPVLETIRLEKQFGG
jgi:hypothetical protein